MTSLAARSQGSQHGSRESEVTPLELLFDLAFAFTMTQLTELLVHDLYPLGIVQLLLIFGVSYWMYGGYVWLSSNLPPNRTERRLLLLLGLAAFLVQALAMGSGAAHAVAAVLALVTIPLGASSVALLLVALVMPFVAMTGFEGRSAGSATAAEGCEVVAGFR